MIVKNFRTTFSQLCVAVLLTTFIPTLSHAKAVTEKTVDHSKTYENLNLFGDVFERIKADYVEEVDEKKLIEAAINGMLTSLDPHSAYLDIKRFEEMQVQTKGEFGGLGIEVTLDAGFVKVVSPIDGTPAAKAGIMAGDYITRLDGKQVLGLTLQEAVEKMRGKVGEAIELTVQREGASEPLKFNIIRDKIEIHAVRSAEYNNIGYIRITTFNSNTYSDLEKEIAKIKKDLGDKLIGYVVDLRSNPGGLLDQAVAVSDAFLERGEIVSTRGRNMLNISRYSAEKGDLADGLPLVVLINEGSASASEIVAGALKEHKRAVLVGAKSFGKGSVQEIRPLSNGAGALRLTTSRYYTPSGTSIQATGIEPDVKIEEGSLDLSKKKMQSISENDLPGHLENERQKQQEVLNKKDKSKLEKSENGVKIIKNEDLDKDLQLKYAIDLVKVMPVVSEVSANKNKAIEAVKQVEDKKENTKEEATKPKE